MPEEPSKNESNSEVLSVVPLPKKEQHNENKTTESEIINVKEVPVIINSQLNHVDVNEIRDEIRERGRKLEEAYEINKVNTIINAKQNNTDDDNLITTVKEEVTTEIPGTSEMTKIFSELHKVLEENDKTTQKIDFTTTTSTETPEKEITTVSNEKLVETETTAPRLDNDEKNETNPIEENPSDGLLNVIPLETKTEKNNEISTSKENTSEIRGRNLEDVLNEEKTTNAVDSNTEKMEIKTEEPKTTTTVILDDTAHEKTLEDVLNEEIKTINTVDEPKETTEKMESTTLDKVPETTMTPATEISIVTTRTDVTTTPEPQKTEDTTQKSEVSPTEIPTSENPSTVHAETIETVTDTIKIVENVPSTDLNDLLASSTENVDKALNNTNISDPSEHVTESTDNTTKTDETDIISEKITTTTKTVSAVVHETQTENAEKVNSINETKQKDEEILSVIPLKKSNSILNKDEKKRVAENDFNKLNDDTYLNEAEFENGINDINKYDNINKFKATSTPEKTTENVIMSITETPEKLEDNTNVNKTEVRIT